MLSFILFITSITFYKIAKIAQYRSDFGDEIYTTIYMLPFICNEVLQNEPDYV